MILDKICDVVAYLKGKSALMIHDRYPETINGWSKLFWEREDIMLQRSEI